MSGSQEKALTHSTQQTSTFPLPPSLFFSCSAAAPIWSDCLIARKLIACVSDWRDSRLRLGVVDDDCSDDDDAADDDDGLSAPPLVPSFASDNDAKVRSEGASFCRYRREVAEGRETGAETGARPAMQGSRLAVAAALVKRSIVFF